MLISHVSQDRTIPQWDEIRNLSIEDKYSLIAKIESSLGDVDMSESTNSIHGIPREVMIAAAEYALKENRAGRCIPNSQVESFIKAKRGWKQFGQTWLNIPHMAYMMLATLRGYLVRIWLYAIYCQPPTVSII